MFVCMTNDCNDDENEMLLILNMAHASILAQNYNLETFIMHVLIHDNLSSEDQANYSLNV